MTIPQLAALLATITLVLFIGVASFGPIRVRMVLMRASFDTWVCGCLWLLCFVAFLGVPA